MIDIGSLDTDSLGKDYRRIAKLAASRMRVRGISRGDLLSLGENFSSPHAVARVYYEALASQDPEGVLQTAGFYLSGGRQVSDAFRALLQEFRLNSNAEAKNELFVAAFAKALTEERKKGGSLDEATTLRSVIEAGLSAIARPGQALDTLLYRHFRNPNMAKMPEAPKTNDPAALEQHRKAFEAHKKRSNEILDEKAKKDPALRKKLDEVKAFEKNQRDIMASPQAGQPSRLMVIQPDGSSRRGVNSGGRTVEEIQRDLRGLPPTPR